MEKFVLDIKQPPKIKMLLNSIAWVLMGLSILIFVVITEFIPNGGAVIAFTILLGVLLFLINYIFFPAKKSGELFLTDNEVRILQMGKKKHLPFREISKITVILPQHGGEFHKDWWPVNDVPGPYHASFQNQLLAKLKKGKSIMVPFCLSSKKQEKSLLTILRENSEKYGFELKVK
ncbi:hypothetical protein M3O96_00640 [Aquiflexum sp. TKW24L]|uniref:hypothetical protein n=1 Tax=Aquiflexum sp. TKW24L TaxID=2942212 RepID=UPI0020BFF46A|nr:hypothetical protein [Aquiflexum sp. TKW24L]MCL6257575.1 hypothetical protein [Aquiflexum sp. TKW24L]